MNLLLSLFLLVRTTNKTCMLILYQSHNIFNELNSYLYKLGLLVLLSFTKKRMWSLKITIRITEQLLQNINNSLQELVVIFGQHVIVMLLYIVADWL